MILDTKTSLLVTPNLLTTGELATLRVEFVPDELTREPLTFDLLEVDAKGANGVAVARFKAQIVKDPADGTFRFGDSRRQTLDPAHAADDAEPTARADTSRDGATTFPFETTWRQACFKLKLDGTEQEHRIVLRVAGGTDVAKAEHMVYELKLVATNLAGEEVFSSGTQLTTVHCADALVHNAAAAAITMLEGHHYLCANRAGGGDYYGSQAYVTDAQKRGRKVTSCITFCLQILERAFAELGASADNRMLRGAAQNGGVFATKIKAAGWKLIYFHKSKADHDAVPKEQQDPYWRINQRALAQEVFKTFGANGVVCDEPIDELVHSYAGSSPDAAAKQRYEELGRQMPFAVVALSLGDHMAVKVGERIYECHWSSGPADSYLFDRASKTWTSIMDYQDFFYVAVPPGYLDATWPGKTEEERREQLTPAWDQIAQPTGEWRPSDITTAPHEGESDSDSWGDGDDSWGDEPTDTDDAQSGDDDWDQETDDGSDDSDDEPEDGSGG